MDKDIAVQVSREGNITLLVPETVNRLEHEKVNLLITLLQRALDDSKQVQGYLKKIETITKPYNSLGRRMGSLTSIYSEIKPMPDAKSLEFAELVDNIKTMPANPLYDIVEDETA